MGLLPALKSQVAEGEQAGPRCIFLDLGPSLGPIATANRWAGVVCARGGPRVLVGESAWGFGTCPCCQMVLTEVVGDGKSPPFLLDAQPRRWSPLGAIGATLPATCK